MSQKDVLIEAINAVPFSDTEANFAPLSCQIQANTLVCFLGQQFSLLNTYMQMLAELTVVDSGKVRYFSETGADKVENFPEIAYLKMDSALLSILNGFDNVKLPALYHQLGSKKDIDKQVAILLNELEYDADHSVLPDFMSVLQKRHLLIARSLILQPKVLFIENPFAGLELQQMQILGDYLATLVKQKKLTVIVSDAPLTFVKNTAEKIISCHPEGNFIFEQWQSFSDVKNTPLMRF